MATLRLTLQRDVFQHHDERLVGLVNVTKPHKKKKMCFLTVVINDEKRSYLICLVKKVDEQRYKKHTSWPLTDLRVVDGKSDQKETNEFDLHFVGSKQVYKWMASSVQDKYAFVQLLHKLSHQGTSIEKPDFVNLPKSVLSAETHTANLLANVIGGKDSKVINGGGFANADGEDAEESYQALTSREEADLERLMEQCEFTIHNAEAFTEQLSREVSSMDSTNIQHIMASEQRVQSLMEELQSAIDESMKLEQKIEHYETLLKNVRDVVFQVEQKEAIVQVQNDNNRKLQIELEFLINQLDFSQQSAEQLLEGDLTSLKGVALTIIAANALQDALNANIHPALNYMNAVQEQKKMLERIRARFSSRLSHHLNNLFQHLLNQFGDNLISAIGRSELTLATHSVIHEALRCYGPLMRWLKANDKDIFLALYKNYIAFMKQQYEQEIVLFFELAKERLSGGRYSSTTGVMSMQEGSGKKKDRRGSSSIAMAAMNPDMTFETASNRSSEISLSEWEEFDACIERMLTTIDPAILAEQQFCVEFFDINLSEMSQSSTAGSVVGQQSTSSYSPSPSPSNMSQSSSETTDVTRSESLRSLMSQLFFVFESEFSNFASFYDKIDGLYSMYLLVRLTQHVLSAPDAGSFLSKTYGNVLIQVKRNFDRFMQAQQIAIEEAKAPKRPKCGVLPFIKGFELFAKQAENIFKSNVQRRADVDRWYTSLVRAIFESINRISIEHGRTPPEMIRLENYHYLHNALSTLKIQCLENEKKEAKSRYNESLKDYVQRYFGRPLEKLNAFFEGVQQKVSQGVKEQEVGYQLAFSKQELRKVIQDCGLKQVKKGLEEMYRKVEKHACEPDTNLIQVIWRSMQEEFITQYKAIQDMIERCYPDANITLGFSVDDVLNVFSEIAQSH